MGLYELAEVPLRPLPALVALVGVHADVAGLLPRFPGQVLYGGVERGEDGGVGGEVGEEGGRRLVEAGEGGEGCEGAHGAQDVGEGNGGLVGWVIPG